MRLFSNRRRPVHMGPYPLERLLRSNDRSQTTTSAGMAPAAVQVPGLTTQISFERPEEPASIVNAMREFQAMIDAIREGQANVVRSEITDDPLERAHHLKAFAYFCDASMVGIGALQQEAFLPAPWANPEVERLAQALRTRQTRTLASGIDVIMAELGEAMEVPHGPMDDHTHVLMVLYEFLRDPRPDEPGAEWLHDAQPHRACLRASETANVLANYIRLLGWPARTHTATASEINLGQAAWAAGLCDSNLEAPWIGRRFGVAAVTTTMELALDTTLLPMCRQPRRVLNGIRWQLGWGHAKSARNRDPFARRDYALGPWPFERLKRTDKPTTHIDSAHVARVPKRTDMFARAQFGDMGPEVQSQAAGGHYARKAAPSFAQRRLLGALVLLQDGEPVAAAEPRPLLLAADTARRNAANIKAASYFLGIDAVGLSRCPDWAWYSHDARGETINPPHDQAISMIVDQGHETMEGASGDDWISVAQSMRAYLRFSLLGGVIGQQLRNLGFKAKAHTVLDGDVLQPPLLLLSGLGEVSRIGEVILNPFLGPRLKSGVVTTNMPLHHDRPIDFGLQAFCEACNKCARECPSGAITAGPKRMFNGYEIWKSDSQKCATYRVTTKGGAMCGRCMKTCPWNLEGLFAEAPFRWMASNLPVLAPALARLDDHLGRGDINPVKKWWWDLELAEDGAYRPARAPVNRRGLQTRLKIRFADQTMAVYPAPLAPPPWPWPFPMIREKGIAAHQALISAREYRARAAAGDTQMIHRYRVPGDSPVLPVVVARADELSANTRLYELRDPGGRNLPQWTAGGHVDIVIAPEYLRQFSLCGDPADRSHYLLAVQREDGGKGGSRLMHRIFSPGRRIFISRPLNNFELEEDARFSLLLGAGIGVTPMVAFAHRLHALNRPFALHYSASTRETAAFAGHLAALPFADRVTLHISSEGTRADLAELTGNTVSGTRVYSCGPDRFMGAVRAAVAGSHLADDVLREEYFSVPELPPRPTWAFEIALRDGRRLHVGEGRVATDVLLENAVHVDVKCSDGLCGTCRCRVRSGEVDHRDLVLSQAQRQEWVILCQSRAARPGGLLELDL